MSDNLRVLGAYSAAMESGDGDAVYAFWAEEFHSHVTTRVSPDKVGTDVRITFGTLQILVEDVTVAAMNNAANFLF